MWFVIARPFPAHPPPGEARPSPTRRFMGRSPVPSSPAVLAFDIDPPNMTAIFSLFHSFPCRPRRQKAAQKLPWLSDIADQLPSCPQSLAAEEAFCQVQAWQTRLPCSSLLTAADKCPDVFQHWRLPGFINISLYFPYGGCVPAHFPSLHAVNILPRRAHIVKRTPPMLLQHSCYVGLPVCPSR